MGGLLASLASFGVKDLVLGVLDRVKIPPEKKAEIELALIQNQTEVLKIESELNAKLVESVNATMREEAKSEHWAQWLWRPTVGFTFSAVLVNNFILYPYFAKYGMASIQIPAEVWTSILVVLGAAAATRGWEKVARAKNGKSD